MLEGIFDEGYGIIPKKIMKFPRLSIYAKAIMIYFLSFTEGDKIECRPKISTIAFDLQISESAIKRGIKDLINIGFIKKKNYIQKMISELIINTK